MKETHVLRESVYILNFLKRRFLRHFRRNMNISNDTMRGTYLSLRQKSVLLIQLLQTILINWYGKQSLGYVFKYWRYLRAHA